MLQAPAEDTDPESSSLKRLSKLIPPSFQARHRSICLGGSPCYQTDGEATTHQHIDHSPWRGLRWGFSSRGFTGGMTSGRAWKGGRRAGYWQGRKGSKDVETTGKFQLSLIPWEALECQPSTIIGSILRQDGWQFVLLGQLVAGRRLPPGGGEVSNFPEISRSGSAIGTDMSGQELYCSHQQRGFGQHLPRVPLLIHTCTAAHKHRTSGMETSSHTYKLQPDT